MKKEYYIQGDPARGKEIKAAFKAKGIDTACYGLDHDEFLYYSSNGSLYFEDFSNTLLNVFKTNPGYTELPLSVEHNFKVHDWVVDGDRVAIIYDLQKNGYVGHDVNRRDFVCRYSDESRLHLWTIQDAKDGDVLVCYSEVKGNPIEQAGIFKQYVGRHGGCSNAFLAHTGIDWDGNIIINGHMGSTNILPATKEQRDRLFGKMREAGYEWDAEKKELRKIFKVGDWIVRGEGFVYEPSLITEIRDYYICELLNGERVTYTLNDVHKNFHLWAIEDAQDGDVLATDTIICIFKKLDKDGYIVSPCIYTVNGGLEVIDDEDDTIGSCGFKPATKEDRELLFRKMKEAGYEWDADKKELRKIQPHYDIANFHEGMPVLVRDDNGDEWNYLLFSHYRKKFSDHFFAGGSPWFQCVPFDKETKHLLGTTDPCDERYVNW